MKPIDFYFDFISPYAYLAAKHVGALAARHGREVRWIPFRLGVAVVKVMGLRPVMETPLKGPYAAQDVVRLAKVLNEPLVFSGTLPDPLPPARLFYGAPSASATTLAWALLRAQWAQGLDIGSVEVLRDVAASTGLDSMLVEQVLKDPDSLDRLRSATHAALARGVFGSPTCAVGDALFWGVDRLWLLDAYLQAGERYEALDHERSRALGLD